MNDDGRGAQDEVKRRSTGEIFAILRRRIWVVALCAMLVAGAALGASLLQTKQYSATASLLFRDPGFDQRLFGSQAFNSTDPAREAATNLNLVSLDAVADLTAENVAGDVDGDDVTDMVAVETQGASNVVSVTATDPDPEFAATIANAFAESYVQFRRDADRAKINGAINLVEREFANLGTEAADSDEGRTLKKQVGRLQALSALQTGNAEIVQVAEPPDSPSLPRTGRNVAIGLFVGLLIGVVGALLLERFDRRIRQTSELEEVFGLPLLANVPESSALLKNADATVGTNTLPGAEAESFRMLRTRLRYFNVDRDIKVVLTTSSAPDDGKSTISWNLAAIAADTGSRALLIEADFRRPTAARRHGLAPAPGLAELLSRQAPLDAVTQQIPVSADTAGVPGSAVLDVITSGSPPPSPADLLGSQEMKNLLHHLKQTYDMIVLDAPPILVIADPIPLVSMVDGVVVVARLNKTTTDQADGLRKQLENLGAPVLGVVANRSRVGHGDGYGYYYGTDAPAVEAAGATDP